MGCVFEVYNELGSGKREKYYERALEVIFKDEHIEYSRQAYIPITIRSSVVGKYFFDFLIENKIVLELKVGERFKKKDFEQVYQYLQETNLKLGIVVLFTKDCVRFRRVVNY